MDEMYASFKCVCSLCGHAHERTNTCILLYDTCTRRTIKPCTCAGTEHNINSARCTIAVAELLCVVPLRLKVCFGVIVIVQQSIHLIEKTKIYNDFSFIVYDLNIFASNSNWYAQRSNLFNSNRSLYRPIRRVLRLSVKCSSYK